LTGRPFFGSPRGGAAPAGTGFAATADIRPVSTGVTIIDSAKVQGGAAAIAQLSTLLEKTDPLSSDDEARRKAFYTVLKGSRLFYKDTNADPLAPYFDVNTRSYQDLTWIMRKSILGLLSASINVTTAVDTDGNLRQVDTVFSRGKQVFFLTQPKLSTGTRKTRKTVAKKPEKAPKSVEILVMKRPTIRGSTLEEQARRMEERIIYDMYAYTAYSKKNYPNQLRVIKLLSAANERFSDAFAEKTGRAKGVALAIETSSGQNTIVTLDDLAAMRHTLKILISNLVYSNSLGRSQVVDPNTFSGAANKPVMMEDIFVDWLSQEPLGIITPEHPRGCYTVRSGNIGTEMRFVCADTRQDAWGQIRLNAAELYKNRLGGALTYEDVIGTLNNGNMFIHSGIGKIGTIRSLMYLFRMFGTVENRQNYNLSQLPVGTQIKSERSQGTDGKKGSPNVKYIATDALNKVLGPEVIPAVERLMTNDVNKITYDQSTGRVFQIPLMAFAKILKVLTLNVSSMKTEDIPPKLAPLLNKKLDNSEIVGSGIPLLEYKKAIHAEAIAIEDYKTLISNTIQIVKAAKEKDEKSKSKK
jgi:hypothetical protein